MEDKGLQLAKQVVKYYFDSYPIEKKMLKSAVDILDKNGIDILKEYKVVWNCVTRKNFPDICDILASLEGKNKLKKEIHFYKDLSSAGVMNNVLTNHNATTQAIKIGDDVIHTFAISALDFASLLDKGYDIYLHENHKSFQIKEGHVEATEKEIRKAHNIMNVWIGGGFADFFYGKKKSTKNSINDDTDLTADSGYMDIFYTVRDVICDMCCLKKEIIQFDTIISSNIIDELDVVEIIMKLEMIYNITIDEVESDNFYIVADIVKLIWEKTK